MTTNNRPLVQVAQRAEDLARASAWYADLLGREPSAADEPPATVERLRINGVEVDTEPHVILTHEDDTLGPAGTDEWQAFVPDSEGNLVGLVEQRPRD